MNWLFLHLLTSNKAGTHPGRGALKGLIIFMIVLIVFWYAFMYCLWLFHQNNPS